MFGLGVAGMSKSAKQKVYLTEMKFISTLKADEN
jgi:hypothetical protein